jgi:quercetin dioxygenase-like cupin family protein
MVDGKLNFRKVFADLPKVKMPFDESLPVQGWLISGESAQVAFWHAENSYKCKEHVHPYAEWGIVITGWCDITTPAERHRYQAGDIFYVDASVPHASLTSDDYRSMDVFFSPEHFTKDNGDAS